jgi:hypothetical protein
VAQRPVFIPDPRGCLVDERLVEFKWHPGFALAQKQRSINALHQAASQLGLTPILEVSTKSPHPLGAQLSAFNLPIDSEELGERLPLEAAFQGSKVFSQTGQHPEVYQMRSGADIKSFVRTLDQEAVIGFRFGGRTWGPETKTAFYDWLYLRALTALLAERPQLVAELGDFAGFTDIEFNPKRSLNCQARSCALFVALAGSDRLQQLVAHPDEFVETLGRHHYGCSSSQKALL